jgi:hypothetical protein
MRHAPRAFRGVQARALRCSKSLITQSWIANIRISHREKHLLRYAERLKFVMGENGHGSPTFRPVGRSVNHAPRRVHRDEQSPAPCSRQ